MSKRLQVILSDHEMRELHRESRKLNIPVAELVRGSLRRTLQTESLQSRQTKLSKLLKLAQCKGPTGNIDQILAEIEAGRA